MKRHKAKSRDPCDRYGSSDLGRRGFHIESTAEHQDEELKQYVRALDEFSEQEKEFNVVLQAEKIAYNWKKNEKRQ